MRIIRSFTTTCAVVCALLPTVATSTPNAERPRLAVLGLVGTGVDATVTQSLTGLLGTEITRLERYDVVGEDDVRGLVAAASLAQALGCNTSACAADVSAIGQTLNAGLLVSGTVGRVGEAHVINLTLLDPRTAKPVNRTSTTVPQLDALASSVRTTVLALFGIAGQLVLWNQPDGAQAFVDERFVGTTPVRKIDLPREGEFTVRVYRDDATPFETKVTVKAGEVARVRVESLLFQDLEERAASRRRWGTGFVVGGGAALAGATVLYLLGRQNDAAFEEAIASGELDPRDPADTASGRAFAATNVRYAVGATAAGVAGLALTGLGTWLLVDNPWQQTLEQYAVAPLPHGGAMVAMNLRF